MTELTAREEPVLVSRIAHLVREGGAFYDERRWLSAPRPADQAAALDVLRRAGVTRFGLVQLELQDQPPELEGWRAVGRDRVRFLSGVDLRVTTYEAA